jgi:hypothetical protein
MNKQKTKYYSVAKAYWTTKKRELANLGWLQVLDLKFYKRLEN